MIVIVPGVSLVPIERNHSGPFGKNIGKMAHALDVIDQGGIAFRGGRADADEKRREVPGHRVVAIDDLQQGLLFAEEIIIRAQNDFQKTARRYSRRLEFGNGLSQPLDRMDKLFLMPMTAAGDFIACAAINIPSRTQ